uniref:Uncharacterized protein n=1 Tax=Micrurus spixii TaxID=129469 RepID=A0A2D4NIG7_9SAUR
MIVQCSLVCMVYKMKIVVLYKRLKHALHKASVSKIVEYMTFLSWHARFLTNIYAVPAFLSKMLNRKKKYCFCMQRYFSCNPEVHLDPAIETHAIKLWWILPMAGMWLTDISQAVS